eukprot:8676960-Alexandrium_andersonii.AAC.1
MPLHRVPGERLPRGCGRCPARRSTRGRERRSRAKLGAAEVARPEGFEGCQSAIRLEPQPLLLAPPVGRPGRLRPQRHARGQAREATQRVA